jgi:signal recognition particle GTPase
VKLLDFEIRDSSFQIEMISFFKKALGGAESKPPDPKPQQNAPPSKSGSVNAARSGLQQTTLTRTRSQRERNAKRESFQTFLENMPLCAEKLLLELLYFFEYEKTKKTDASLLENPEAVAKQLEDQLRAENLYSDTEIKGSLKKLLTAIREVNADDGLIFVDEILEQIRPLEIDALLESVDVSRKFSNVIKDKDVILLLGVSGAGKSTTIQFLAGSPMHQIEVEGLLHIEASEFKNSAVETVKTSPFSKSETRSINAVVINLHEIGMDREDSVIVCDTPGFGE